MSYPRDTGGFLHSLGSSPPSSGGASNSSLSPGREVPYSADEVAEDLRWNENRTEAGHGTPSKQDLRLSPTTLETTPSKEDLASLQLQSTPLKRSGPVAADRDGNWPWAPPELVDTWSVLTTTTPQRVETVGSTSTADLDQLHPRAHYNPLASSWSTDQEDGDLDQDALMPSGMTQLSLHDESLERHQQQMAILAHTQAMQHSHAMQAQQQQYHQHQQQQQHQMQLQQHSLQQHAQQPQTQQYNPYAQPQPQYTQPPQPQHQLQSGFAPITHRHPSPPPLASQVFVPNNLRFNHTGSWTPNFGGGSASSQMSIPASVLRTQQFQSQSTFAHSTSGPVRGMPTNQVNYSHSQVQQTQHQQQQQQQQLQQQQHLYVRSASAGGVHSQPVTPVGSFGASTSSAVPSSAHVHSTYGQSHSHPASPRLGSALSSNSSQGDASSVAGSFAGSVGSSFGSTPNLSPLSSPVLSPHSSPGRFAKNTNAPQQQQMNPLPLHSTTHLLPPHLRYAIPPHDQQQPPPQSQQQHHMRSGSSGISSLSSSGCSTPTSQVGPPFQAQAQAVFNYQQQGQQTQQQAHMQQQQQQLHGQRRPMPIQTSQQQQPQPQYQQTSYSQSQQQQQQLPPQSNSQPASHYTAVPSHQQQPPHQQQPQQGGTMIIKNSMPQSQPAAMSTSQQQQQQPLLSTPPNLPPAPLQGDSPNSKARFKVFYRDLWALARDTGDSSASSSSGGGAEKAYEFGLASLRSPDHERIAWKIAMELADLAKRQNHIPRARYWYSRAHTLEPLASQVWIEHAKMEEECGELIECERLMEEGMHHCQGNEAIMIKLLKHYERMGDLASARGVLARLKDAPLDKVWRTVVEGGLMEARMGQMATARRVFKYLISHVNWYGPIYFEFARLEERWGHFDASLAIVERGLAHVSRYGPLWFMAFRLVERTCHGEWERPRLHAQRALQHVSAELVWKMHFELAQTEERVGEFERARDSYAAAILACPPNLRWKIWLSGARMELLSGDAQRVPVVRALLHRAQEEVPKKMRCMVALEQSRMEEFLGNLAEARKILKQAQKESRGEWKVFLESVLLELRSGNIDAAIAEAESALEIHNGTGRLWAILIQLKQKQKHPLGHRVGHAKGSMRDQFEIFRLAIKHCPKSGEAWCEGARLVLNPFAPKYFDLKSAKRFLNFAIQFTPQYGDSFIEYLRLKMILEGIEEKPTLPEKAPTTPLYTAASAEAQQQQAQPAPPVQFHGSGQESPTEGAISTSTAFNSEKPSAAQQQQQQSQSHFYRVHQLCVNAEPNYGSSWFACKSHPLWAPVEVLEVARGMIEKHLVRNQGQYQKAILRNWYAERGNESATSRHASQRATPSKEGHTPSQQEHAATVQEMLDAAASEGDDERSHTSTSPSIEAAESASEMSVEGGASASATDDDDEDSSSSSSSSDSSSTARSSASRLFSPTTVRLARQVESGELALGLQSTPMEVSRAHTPNSIDSALLTSEDDEDDLQALHQPEAEFNSLQILYPPIAQLGVAEKHRALYGADPITP